MPSGHFGYSGPYRLDPASENARLQRQHEERRQQEERWDRTVGWVTVLMAGETYESFEGLRASVLGKVAKVFGRELGEGEIELLTSASRLLWTGFSNPDARVERRYDPMAIHFRAA